MSFLHCALMSEYQDYERPLDCSNCKRKLTTKYTEVSEGRIASEYFMCQECPHLQAFLSSPKMKKENETLSQLTCGNCRTSLLEVQKGELLGCAECYQIFETYLISTLKKEFSLHVGKENAQSLYLGHHPGEFKELGTSERIYALNETLNEMIHQEDYERAASIRDQINELKKKQKKGA